MNTEQFTVPQFRFVGEQDGPTEKNLKDGLVALFQKDIAIKAAYLVKVDFGNGGSGVILGLRCMAGENRQIADSIGKVFASIFARSEHLDILFLSESQEVQIKQVCRSFFLGFFS